MHHGVFADENAKNKDLVRKIGKKKAETEPMSITGIESVVLVTRWGIVFTRSVLQFY